MFTTLVVDRLDGGIGYIAFIDGTVEPFRSPPGDEELARREDFVANDVYVKSGSRWIRVYGYPSRPYGWINSP